MSDINIKPSLNSLQDCLEYMNVQIEAMNRVAAKIEHLDGDPGSNAVRDQEHRANLIENYRWYAGEYKKGLAAFNELSEDLCDVKKFLNTKNVAA